MRIPLIVLSLCCCAVAYAETKVIQAPNEDSKKFHELALHIPPTGAIKYEIRHTADSIRDGRAQQVALKVVYLNAYQQKADQYAFHPKLVGSELESLNGAAPPANLDKRQILAGFVLMNGVSYTTGSDLMPATIEDMKTLKGNYRQMVVDIMKASNEKVDEAKIDATVNAVFSVYDEDSATELFLVEQTLLGYIHGAGLEQGHPTKILIDQAGPVDNVPLKTQYSLSLESWDTKKDLAVANMSLEPDESYLKEYMAKILPQIMGAAGQKVIGKSEMEEMIGSMRISSSTKCRYEIVISTGLANKAECVVAKGITQNGKGQIKTDTYLMSETVE